jgi:VanZ family protein
MQKFVILASVILMLLIFLFSACDATMSSMQSDIIVNYINNFISVNSFLVRKLAHFFLFFLLEMLVYFSIRSIKYSFIFVSLYAILDEVHQYFVPGRSCELRDVIIDISGCVFAIILITLGRYFNDKRTKNNRENS